MRNTYVFKKKYFYSNRKRLPIGYVGNFRANGTKWVQRAGVKFWNSLLHSVPWKYPWKVMNSSSLYQL